MILVYSCFKHHHEYATIFFCHCHSLPYKQGLNWGRMRRNGILLGFWKPEQYSDTSRQAKGRMCQDGMHFTAAFCLSASSHYGWPFHRVHEWDQLSDRQTSELQLQQLSQMPAAWRWRGVAAGSVPKDYYYSLFMTYTCMSHQLVVMHVGLSNDASPGL